MTRKQKNKLMTFIFSCIPGAGHMYIGLMKQGMSLMFLFCGLCFVSAVTGIASILLFLPLIWFYSFFDVHNKNAMDEKEFYEMKDDYLFFDELPDFRKLARGNNTLIFAIILFFIGGVLLLDTISYFMDFVLGGVPKIVIFILVKLPVVVVAGAAIWAGYELIQMRKKNVLVDGVTASAEKASNEENGTNVEDAEYRVIEETAATVAEDAEFSPEQSTQEAKDFEQQQEQ